MQCADLGLRLALTVALLGYAGYRLDAWIDSAPIFLIVGSFLGLALGLTMTIRAVNRALEGRRDGGS